MALERAVANPGIGLREAHLDEWAGLNLTFAERSADQVLSLITHCTVGNRSLLSSSDLH